MINQEKTLELVDRSQRKDTAAFAQLVTEFQPMVFRLAFRLLCDENEARDITQETFVKVWLFLKRYNRKNRFSTWLYKITCNTCYDRLRSLYHSPLDNEADYSVSVNISSDDNVELAVVNKQLRELILRYTDELSPRQRLIFTLRDIEELDVPEVQTITGLSAGITTSESLQIPIPISVHVPSPLLSKLSPSDGFRIEASIRSDNVPFPSTELFPRLSESVDAALFCSGFPMPAC